MTIEIGQVEAIFRYPVKSMAGERVEVANIGWPEASPSGAYPPSTPYGAAEV